MATDKKISQEAKVVGDAVASFCQQMIDHGGAIPQVEFEAGEGSARFKVVVEKI